MIFFEIFQRVLIYFHSDASFSVFVRGWHGNSLQVTVSTADTVQKLVDNLVVLLKIDMGLVPFLVLYYMGTPLIPIHTVSSYGLKSGCTVEFTIPLHGGANSDSEEVITSNLPAKSSEADRKRRRGARGEHRPAPSVVPEVLQARRRKGRGKGARDGDSDVVMKEREDDTSDVVPMGQQGLGQQSGEIEILAEGTQRVEVVATASGNSENDDEGMVGL